MPDSLTFDTPVVRILDDGTRNVIVHDLEIGAMFEHSGERFQVVTERHPVGGCDTGCRVLYHEKWYFTHRQGSCVVLFPLEDGANPFSEPILHNSHGNKAPFPTIEVDILMFRELQTLPRPEHPFQYPTGP